ncbi:MAG: M23 family metallopeptidase [Microbacteriaceae bacterium]|nr:M23 family metallopeptidase [Microbacteriaceae bacterium]
MERSGGIAAAAIAAPVLLIVGLFTIILLIMAPAGQAAACGPPSRIDVNALPEGPVAGYSGDALEAAAEIMNAGVDAAMSRQAQVIAVMVAITDADLQLEDPAATASEFYTALSLTPGWEQLSGTVVAFQIHGGDDPFAYEAAEAVAVEIVGTLAGGGQVVCQSGYLVMPLDPEYRMTDDFGPRPCPLILSNGACAASTWHPAVDLQNTSGPCGAPIYAITAGTVTYAAGYQMSVRSPEGYTVHYLHMAGSDMLAAVGETVEAGQQISRVGSNGPSTGCHLDLRINVVGTTNTTIAGLPRSESIGGPVGWVDPEAFYAALGLELCPSETCGRTY